MRAEQHIVDNRVLLLGLDELYRAAMKRREVHELLPCAERVADALGASPAEVPIEGYYTEDPRLTKYFRLVRSLQGLGEFLKPKVSGLPEYQRLLEVVSSPIFGSPSREERLLPVGKDSLARALERTFPDWTVATLTSAAFDVVQSSDDISLVGLAARLQDAVALAALRESVVLYAEMVLGMVADPPPPEYIWKVDADFARHARAFVDAFNALFGNDLPSPEPSYAETFWHAYDRNSILGRCVRIGADDLSTPIRYYHWAIRRSDGVLNVHEFWDTDVWTTERYCASLGLSERYHDR
jgi:hypothetical protein